MYSLTWLQKRNQKIDGLFENPVSKQKQNIATFCSEKKRKNKQTNLMILFADERPPRSDTAVTGPSQPSGIGI